MNRVATMNIGVLALVAGTVPAAPPAERDGQTALAVSSTVAEEPSRVARNALHRTVDLSLGESQAVELTHGRKTMLKLVGLEEIRDGLCSAVREARVKVEVNGQPITLTSATYHLSVTIAGVQIDCPITRGYTQNARTNRWGLGKDARLRLWPVGSPWIAPETFVYPARQRWFASDTQMANEPVFVDGGVKSDGNVKPRAPDGYAETVHRYAKPGHYLVRVERVGHTGAKAIAYLHVRVGREP